MNILRDKLKIFIEDMKNIKTISRKRRITYICAISAIVLVIAISASTGSRSSETVAALYQTSALPSGMSQAISMGIYDDISVGQMLVYMFKNPKISVSRGDSGSKIVEISGYHRVTLGGDYCINGQISFKVSESGTCTVQSDPGKIMGIMQSIAVQLAYN